MTQSGFGNIDGEYWLGLEAIYGLGRQGDYKLLVEMEDWMDKKVYAQYSSFHLEPESEGYRLRLGTYQGNAGDSLSSHNGKQFTTLDRDKDAFSGKQYSIKALNVWNLQWCSLIIITLLSLSLGGVGMVNSKRNTQ